MKQQSPMSRLSEQQIEEIRQISQSRRQTILASLGPNNPLLQHTIMRQRSGLSVLASQSGIVGLSTAQSSPPSTSGGNVADNDFSTPASNSGFASAVTSSNGNNNINNSSVNNTTNAKIKGGGKLLFDIQEGLAGDSLEISGCDSSVVSTSNNQLESNSQVTDEK